MPGGGRTLSRIVVLITCVLLVVSYASVGVAVAGTGAAGSQGGPTPPTERSATVTDRSGAVAGDTSGSVAAQTGPSITLSSSSPQAGDLLTATAVVSVNDSEVSSYDWRFGDGGRATGKRATHVYTEPGTYTIEVEITYEQGVTDTVNRTVEVGGTAVGADPGASSGSFETVYVDHFENGDLSNYTVTKGDESAWDTESKLDGTSAHADAADTANTRLKLDEDQLQLEDGIRLSFDFTASTDDFNKNARAIIETDSTTYVVKVALQGNKLRLNDKSTDGPLTETTVSLSDGATYNLEWTVVDGNSTVVLTEQGGSTTRLTYDHDSIGTPQSVALSLGSNDGKEGETWYDDLRVGTRTTEATYDTDGDGLESSELDSALRDLDANGSDLTVEESRELIQQNLEDRRATPPEPSNDTNATNDSEGTTDTDGDGLPDSLEERGINVTNSYQFGDLGEQANVTDPVAGDGLVRLHTNRSKSDTDGDGRSDSVELDERINGSKSATSGVGFLSNDSGDGSGIDTVYYTLDSDPTDPNTDDTGVDDKEEVKKGSDPTDPEWVSVDVIVPVKGKENCNQDLGSGNACIAENGGDAMLKAEEQKNYDGQSTPNWLPGDVAEEGYTYWLVRVGVTLNHEAKSTDDIPTAIEFTGVGSEGTLVAQGPDKTDLTPGYSTTLNDPSINTAGGTKTVYLIIRTEQEAGKKSLGRLRGEVTFPSDSVFNRGSGRTVSFSTREIGISSKVSFTSTSEVKAMTKEATKKLGQNLISASVPTGGSLAAKTASSSGTKIAAEVFVDGFATLTGAGNTPAVGQDDLIGKAFVSEGAVPYYIKNADTGQSPTTNTAVTVYRAN